ncbi:MAG: LacI family transcriptional regulator [Acholeplasmataceae bacterium]|jgi:LacI family transcriptional regulator|nr:LacI family transcriptional regulator [Acholeplasmataceae bacterium]
MKPKVTMDDIARRFAVSKVTVSKALNNKDGVSEELRMRIKEEASKLGYSINNAARSLRTQKSNNVGLLIAERYINNDNSYYFGVCGRIISQLTQFGYSGVMETLSDEVEKALRLPLMYTEGKVDALIVVGQLSNDYLRLFENFKIPVVFFDFYVDGIDVDSIIVDNFFSGFAVAQHLIKKGHKRIGFVGSLNSTSSIQDRFLGFYRALLVHNLKINYDYIIDDRDPEGHMINLELPKEMPTAFICNNDEVAYRFIQKLKVNNYRVPEDISVVSFDNILYSTLSVPALTTVDNNVDEMVKVVCKMIMKKLNVPEKVYGCIQVKSFIVYRDSVREIKEEK